MSVVNNISICQVETKQEGIAYSVRLCWSAVLSPGPYLDKWTIRIKDKTERTIVYEEVGSDVYDYTLHEVKLKTSERYCISVEGRGGQNSRAEETLAVYTYQNVKGNYDGKAIRLTWKEPDLDIRKGKCNVLLKKDGKEIGSILGCEIPFCARKMKIPFSDDFYGPKEAFTIVLTPYYSDISSGPEVIVEDVFAPYYCFDDMKNFRYYCMEIKENVLSVKLNASPIYREEKGVPEEAITSGPLSLNNIEEYTLTVQTNIILEPDIYRTFIEKCYQYVTPAAMYEILDFISRSALQGISNMLEYSCGFSDAGADIRPGFAIRVEQASYQYQSELGHGNVSGYIGSNDSTYKVSLHQGDKMSYLEFDSFVSLMEVTMYSIDKNYVQEQIAAGVLDFCSVNVREPYYHIQYPEAMYTSDVLPDSYPNTHVLLVAAPSWDKVPLPVNGEDNATTPYLFFRGRSAITLLFTITVNGKEEEIPAGTTLGKLLNQKGIYHIIPEVVRLFRRNPYGAEAEIIMDGADVNLLSQLPLMNGDRMEI